MPRLLRMTTVPISLNILLKGQLKFMREHGLEVITASAPGPEVEELVNREGVNHYPLPFTRIISPWRDLVCLINTIRLIRHIKPDIIHTHTPKAGLIGMLASWYVGVPHRLHTVAGMPLMEANGISKIILRCTEKLTYRFATQVYPNSRNLEKWINTHLKPDKSKVKVIGSGSSNGIDTEHFNSNTDLIAKGVRVRNELNIKTYDVVYVFVGRLVHDKGISELVKAFSIIKDKQLHLLLLGEYENEREPVEKGIKDHIETDKQIHAVGFKTDIRPFLAAADIFVFPSYREGFPNVVMQAGCFNLPCIVTDINGSNEIIKDGYNGLIVSPKEVEELRAAMMKLGNDSMLRKRMGQVARKQIVSNYDQQIVWKAILKEYKRLLILHGVQRPN